jgi:hypothetical protein
MSGIDGTDIQALWEGLAELARRIGGRGCYWMVILFPFFGFGALLLYVAFLD